MYRCLYATLRPIAQVCPGDVESQGLGRVRACGARRSWNNAAEVLHSTEAAGAREGGVRGLPDRQRATTAGPRPHTTATPLQCLHAHCHAPQQRRAATCEGAPTTQRTGCSPACSITTDLVCIWVMHPDSRNSISTPQQHFYTAHGTKRHRPFTPQARAPPVRSCASSEAEALPALPGPGPRAPGAPAQGLHATREGAAPLAAAWRGNGR